MREIAYLFWHRPAPGVDPAAYEAGMQAFHTALARSSSATFRIAATPWTGDAPAYEDWYPVADWADLGRLEHEAVGGARKAPHDAVAARAGWGAGGVWGRVRGTRAPHETGFAAWLAKPPGVSYDELHAALPATADVWQRRLVLGPAPEFVVLADAPLALPVPAVTTAPRLVAAHPGRRAGG